MVIVGIQFISMGLIGEMIVKISKENDKKSYGIKEYLK